MENVRETLYEHIVKVIKERIMSGTYAADARLPSEAELINEFSVSRITVKKAMAVLAEQGFIVRKQGKGTYVKLTMRDENDPMEYSGVRRVAVIYPQELDFYDAGMLKAIVNHLKYPKYITCTFFRKDGNSENQVISEAYRWGADAMIIYPSDTEEYSDAILSMHLSGYPVVLLDRNLPGIGTAYVISDNRSQVIKAVDRLVDCGHRSIAYYSVSKRHELIGSIRFEAFTNALTAHGILPTAMSDMTDAAGEKSEEYNKLLLSGRITAVICGNIISFERLKKLLDENDMSIPDDISIVLYDEPRYYGDGMTFDHITQNPYEKGLSAARAVEALMNPNSLDSELHTVLPQEYIEGNSIKRIDIPNKDI